MSSLRSHYRFAAETLIAKAPYKLPCSAEEVDKETLRID
jgi:hypothetical protein